MIGRLVQSADFQRVLATAPRSRSAHFAIHHMAQRPLARRAPAIPADSTELSTGDAIGLVPLVDDLPGGWWLGTVVPKRHARRAVTRSLMKRQIRVAMQQHAATLAPGLWVVRLKAPFAPGREGSAVSEPLREAARHELAQLFRRAASA